MEKQIWYVALVYMQQGTTRVENKLILGNTYAVSEAEAIGKVMLRNIEETKGYSLLISAAILHEEPTT